MDPSLFDIQVTTAAWKGYCVRTIGQGATVSDALSDAAKGIGAPFRPKQDGRRPELTSITMQRPDGTRFNIEPNALKFCGSPEALEAARKES